MTTSSADYMSGIPDKPVSVDDLFRDVPVQSVEDLAREGIFDTDEELDEFLEHIYAARRATWRNAHGAWPTATSQ